MSGLEHFIVGLRVSGVLLSLCHGDRKTWRLWWFRHLDPSVTTRNREQRTCQLVTINRKEGRKGRRRRVRGREGKGREDKTDSCSFKLLRLWGYLLLWHSLAYPDEAESRTWLSHTWDFILHFWLSDCMTSHRHLMSCTFCFPMCNLGIGTVHNSQDSAE